MATKEQLPAYTTTPQPGLTPENGGDDALLPQYTFPTRFKIGGVFTDGLLVNIDQIKGHLTLLNAFSNLKTEVEGLGSDSIHDMPEDPEKRWAWFVGLAAERFDVWARCLQSKDALQPLEDTLPPLDVLMVWHSYMLNPRWYTEDSQRILECKTLVDLGQVLCKELAHLPALLDSSPSEARVTMFYTRVGEPFDPFQAASVSLTKKILCPKCRASIVVPYMNDSGSGYLQANFSASCSAPSECPLITKETLCARKLAENLSRQGMAPDSYLPGTFFTESRVADQKAGMELLKKMRQKYKVKTKSHTTQDGSTVNEDLCLKILEGANFKLDEIRGHIGRCKLLGRIMSAHSTSMIYSVELVGAVLRQGSFVQKMAHLDWTKPGFFDRSEDEIVLQHAIARFLDLMSSSPASFFVPTLDIDLVWHTHQLMNAKYEEDCQLYVGRFIDHDDKVDGLRLSSAFDLTCRAWKDRFNTPYTHCGCPPPGDTIGQRLSRFLSSGSSDSTDTPGTQSQLSPPGTRHDMLAATHASEHNAVTFTSRNTKALELAKTRHRQHARRMERRVERERAKELKTIEKGLSKEERKRREKERERDSYYCGYGQPFIMPVPLYYGGGGGGGCVSTAHGVVDHSGACGNGSGVCGGGGCSSGGCGGGGGTPPPGGTGDGGAVTAPPSGTGDGGDTVPPGGADGTVGGGSTTVPGDGGSATTSPGTGGGSTTTLPVDGDTTAHPTCKLQYPTRKLEFKHSSAFKPKLDSKPSSAFEPKLDSKPSPASKPRHHSNYK
ncbi:hypothetical protein EST38_g13647 [Candolleomyces aberdarensis]|uniref:Uncharacterized protein n=1 Tax=Candolleomyces aberdarensis TaxID=2316362 RepID=A0A4Q2CZF2_9AGAR|nr:hypothetical protein EST38_g13647 [Candolleomyces aberdarensis]